MSVLKKIDQVSIPAIENNVAIFDILPTNVAFNRTYLREYNPLQIISRDGPFNYRMFSDSQFIDFSRIWFYLETSLEKREPNTGNWVDLGSTMPSDDDKHVGPIQNFGSSFIKQLKITINGIEVFNSGPLYAYRDYISKEFGLGISVRKGLYEANNYFPDDASIGQSNALNNGFINRGKFWREGGKMCTYSLLNFDLANQNNLFINNTDVQITIYPHKDEFLLLKPDYKGIFKIPKIVEKEKKEGDAVEGEENPKDNEEDITLLGTIENETDYRIKIHAVKIYCTFIDLVQSLQNQIARTLESTPAKYSLRRIELRQLYLTRGQTNLTWNVFNSVIPRRIMVFLVDNNAFDGSIKMSPFHFQHGNLQSISVEANDLTVPSIPYHFDFKNSDSNYVRSFVDFYEGLDIINQERPIELTLEKYKNGWTGWVFPLSSSHRDIGDSFELIKNGTTVIKAHFDTPI